MLAQPGVAGRRSDPDVPDRPGGLAPSPVSVPWPGVYLRQEGYSGRRKA